LQKSFSSKGKKEKMQKLTSKLHKFYEIKIKSLFLKRNKDKNVYGKS